MRCGVDKLGWTAAAALATFATGAPAIADDTEIFRLPASPEVRANVLFIVDDSLGMQATVRSQPPYDPATLYQSVGCSDSRVYWSHDAGAPPTCDTERWFERSALQCDKAAQLLAAIGRSNEDRFAQYDPVGGASGVWRDVVAAEKSRTVECAADGGRHGNGGPETYAIDWTSRRTLTLYSANYVNWYYGAASDQSRLAVVQGVLDDLLQSLEGVNVGLMHFNPPSGEGGSEGGRIAVAVEDIDVAREELRAAVAALAPHAYTPLAETLYEARQYFAGGAVTFGAASTAAAKDPADASRYRSPIVDACQQNFVVVLTDGEPTFDTAADRAIVAMTDANGDGFAALTGNATCDVEPWTGLDVAAPPADSRSQCFDDLAHFLHAGDISAALSDRQRANTLTVGFAVDDPTLEAAAERGNGRAPGDSDGVYFTANDAPGLASALASVASTIDRSVASFTPPTVAVNALNRTEHLGDLFVSVFEPSTTYHWPGSLKKYRLRDDGVIVDAGDAPAVDADTGVFAAGSRSYWSAMADGADVRIGGAANLIPAARLVFTNAAGNDLSAADNRVETANAYLTDELLEVGGTRWTRDDVIRFINGVDPVTSERRFAMGDALHAQPVHVGYGPGLKQGTVFVATNDGYLHAVDAETGVEQWAWIPREFLGDQVDLLENGPLPSKHYALDGPLRVLTQADDDGVIEPGESVYLFLGMRRGGAVYYGLDITDTGSSSAPRVLWRLDAATLPGLGQSWSPAVPTRVRFGGAERAVLVIGGGYEPDQDLDAPSTDTTGNSIYIVDALTGALLWRASKSGATANYAAMEYSIPGEVKVIDLNGDRLMDRLYAADLGGQVWRFDVTNGAATAEDFVAGGVIAQLGAAGRASPTLAENRRFYYSPDVALVDTRLESFYHIGIGSGHREHPLGNVNADRFYALRDTHVANMTQAEFDALPVITDDALTPVTGTGMAMAPTSEGWRLDLLPGEKVLAEARTIANTVFFTTFRPGPSTGACQPPPGIRRLYQMSVYDGSPVRNLDGGLDTEPLSLSDLYVESEGTIPTTSQVVFVARDRDNDGTPDDYDDDDDNDGIPDRTDGDADNDGTPDGADDDDDNDGVLDDDEPVGDRGWVCTDRICIPLGFTTGPVRTYWRQTSLE